jgi:hypothetical protein
VSLKLENPVAEDAGLVGAKSIVVAAVLLLK